MPANTLLRITAFAVKPIDASVFTPGREEILHPLLGARIREVVLYFLENSGISRGYILGSLVMPLLEVNLKEPTLAPCFKPCREIKLVQVLNNYLS